MLSLILFTTTVQAKIHTVEQSTGIVTFSGTITIPTPPITVKKIIKINNAQYILRQPSNHENIIYIKKESINKNTENYILTYN